MSAPQPRAALPPLPPDAISACLVLRHEEAVVDRCLRSLCDVVDEIVVVHDGPCEDRTLEIAAGYGARIFVLPLVGHAERHTVFAFGEARGDWILSVDADEFLSDGLRAGLRDLTRRPDVNGYELLWRMWDGTRYITEHGPFKRCLFRRRAVHLIGHIHGIEVVDPPVLHSDLHLEHRPLYNNFSLTTMLGKWRRWAQIQSQELLTPLDEFPAFNWEGRRDWGPRRRILNRLSPVLVVPYAVATFALEVRRSRGFYSPRENVRLAGYMAAYAAMVQLYVAKRLYVERQPSRA